MSMKILRKITFSLPKKTKFEEKYTIKSSFMFVLYIFCAKEFASNTRNCLQLSEEYMKQIIKSTYFTELHFRIQINTSNFRISNSKLEAAPFRT